ncbi:hypothetical protein [Wohlfahrtiimonas larvae]|uniref:Entry exclusion lipoprotein TrbK n=1 Tax=Wohlfahrtiimonas larvae TaxID=1157986 RepID=A0ABP9MV76_9GAMM|nr:hypothetical protein [Wohlfahrtiimonas larvae]
MNNIIKTIGLIFVITLVAACKPTAPTQEAIPNECIGWKPEIALKTDSKAVMMEKLERNTRMQRICQ